MVAKVSNCWRLQVNSAWILELHADLVELLLAGKSILPFIKDCLLCYLKSIVLLVVHWQEISANFVLLSLTTTSFFTTNVYSFEYGTYFI